MKIYESEIDLQRAINSGETTICISTKESVTLLEMIAYLERNGFYKPSIIISMPTDTTGANKSFQEWHKK